MEVYTQAFGYLVVPQGKIRVRCIVSAARDGKDLSEALDVFESTGRKLRLV